MRNRILLTLLILAFSSLVSTPNLSAQPKWNSVYQNYIDQYKDLAIEQMLRYNIPASITLAQGLLESGAGRSQLTRSGNNHFGIKCHGWKGRRTYHDDDAARMLPRLRQRQAELRGPQQIPQHPAALLASVRSLAYRL